MKLIGLTGKKQCGKSTAANYLENNGFIRMSFADPIKSMVRVMLKGYGFCDDHIDDFLTVNKEVVIPGIGKTARHLFQTLGTEWGRHRVNPDLWVTLAQYDMNTRKLDAVVFDDVRMENEAQLIRNLGGLVVHVDRFNGDEWDSHASEFGILQKPGDKRILNEGTKEAFFWAVDAVIAQHYSLL